MNRDINKNLSSSEEPAHYVCRGGCGGVSGVPKACGTEGCTNYEVDMEVCSCTDDRHGRDEGKEK